ncbi:helix-turn-helix domain-containing protein [Parageobacillus toebii]|uniref:helix-turn-helix domain-containing protein n=1 Tax=Parageobacillus toebii TaxID=153151 RepID=UPI00281539FC|nr:helix-turn-helix domain-containing protein [Parageobacillus toebii]WMT19845.1 helix-turn-helix domain-containing protein [Parageobacillus toebii]
MNKNKYHTLEKFYIYPQYIGIYKLEKHLHDIEKILNTNPKDFSTLNPKKYYFFKMPVCGHPQKISLTELKKRIENNNPVELCCRICKWLINSKINYEQLARLYSVNNDKPLSNVNYRKNEVIFTCPDCGDDTPYKEMRWVLDHLKKGESFKEYCRGKCNSIGMKYPDLVPLWDESRNKISILSVPANDDNLYHRKWYFLCAVCDKPIDTPTTVYNAIINSSRCTQHKINPGTSFAEMAIFFSFIRCLSKFPYIEVNHKYKYYRNREFDIFIIVTINDVQYFFAVEVDGKHHGNTVQKDMEKNQYAANNKIHLERIRDLELADIELENFNNIIQRTSTDKKELNKIIPELLNRFIKWISNLNMENEKFKKLKASIIKEIKNVDVIRDEKAIFQQLDHSTKKLLKDDPDLKPIFDQLREDVRKELGDFITVTEQDIKRPFICSKCGEPWEQYVYVVVRNFRNSKNKATGCPTCANKNKEHNNKLKRKALVLKNEGFTQKEIGEILGRTQSTISSWLSNM